MMEVNSFTIFSIRFLEPGTLISDIALGIACLIFYNSLKNNVELKVHKHYAMFFLYMAFSGFIGAFAHALFLYTGKFLQYIGWVMSTLSVFSLEMAVSVKISDNRKRSIFIKLIKLQLILIGILSAYFMEFVFIKIDLAIGLLLFVSPILLLEFFNSGTKSNLYIVAGIFLALLPAFLHSFAFKFNGYLNMNDFSHYFLIICLFFIYLGVRGIMESELESSL